MKPLYTLCIPKLSQSDAQFVTMLRHKYEGRPLILPTHITLAFACTGVPEQVYLAHVKSIAEYARTFTFTCRKAVPRKVAAGTKARVFLLPKEGYSELSQLHDQLYTGVLKPFAAKAAFVPYITIASGQDHAAAVQACAEINSNAFAVRGTIDSLSVCSVQTSGLNVIAEFRLK